MSSDRAEISAGPKYPNDLLGLLFAIHLALTNSDWQYAADSLGFLRLMLPIHAKNEFPDSPVDLLRAKMKEIAERDSNPGEATTA